MRLQVTKAVAQADYATELRAQILARRRSSGAAAPAPLPAAPHQQINGALHVQPVWEAHVPEDSYIPAYNSPNGLIRAAPLRAPDPHLRDPHLRPYHEYDEYPPAGTWPRASPAAADAATNLYAERDGHSGVTAPQTHMPGLPQLRQSRPSDGQTSRAVAAAVARGFVPLGVLPVAMPGGRTLAGQQAHQHMDPIPPPAAASLQPQHHARQQRQHTHNGYEEQQGVFGPRVPGHESGSHEAAGRALPYTGPDYSGGHQRAQQVHPITGQPQHSMTPLPQQLPSHSDYASSYDRNLNGSSYETAGPVPPPPPPMALPHQPYQPQMLLSTGGASVGRRGHYDQAAHVAAAALPPTGQQMLLNPGGVSVGRRGHYHPDDHAGHSLPPMQQQPMVGASGALIGRRGHYDPAAAARASEHPLQQAGQQPGGTPLNARQQYEADLKAQIADKTARKVLPSAPK